MILDKLENLQRYHFDFFFIEKDLDGNQFQKGKFDINGDKEFGIGLEYQTQSQDKALWEAHRKYLDIHVILDGEEIICISDISRMQSVKNYEEDYELFEGITEQMVHLKQGYFLVLFPHEVHKTGIIKNEMVSVRKKVFKKAINNE